MEENNITTNEMPRNSEIRRAARYALKNNWTQAVLATLVFTLVTAAAGSIPFAGLLVVCPLEFGFMLCFLRLVRGEDSSEMVGDQFSVFSKYGRTLGTSLLMTLYILLWCLLFVIPGIIMSCLDLSFIGWALLCILTLGIGFLWLQPYIEASHAKFYEELKARRS